MTRRRLTTWGALLGLLVLGALLIFPNLGNRYLWEDEAETALLARNVLRFGQPVAFDGVHLISQECGVDSDARYVWRQTGWLPIYVTATSFAWLGESTLSARLPFALLGILAPLSLYALARRSYADRVIAWMAALSLMASVPFLLHVRQARYYSLVIIATIWILYFGLSVIERSRFAAVGLVIALTVLLQSTSFVSAAVLAGLAAGTLAMRAGLGGLLRLAAAVAVALLINLPLLMTGGFGHRIAMMIGVPTPAGIASRLTAFLIESELHAFPAVLFGVALAIGHVLSRRAPVGDSTPAENRVTRFLLVFTVAYLLVVACGPFGFFRYLLGLLPVFALLQGRLLVWLWVRQRVLALAVALLAVVPDRSELLDGSLAAPLGRYVREITHDVDGPIKGLVRHLKLHARPGDRVFITYGDLPLRFYTNLDIRGGQACEDLSRWPEPDWVVVRYFFRFRAAGPRWTEDEAWTKRYLAALPSQHYRRVELDVADTIWDNIPDPALHAWDPAAYRMRLTVYEKVRASAP